MKVSFSRDVSGAAPNWPKHQSARAERSAEFLQVPRALAARTEAAEPAPKMAAESGGLAPGFEPIKLMTLLDEVHKEELDKSTPLVTNADDNFLHRQTFEVFDDRYVDWTSLRIESIVEEYLKESESG